MVSFHKLILTLPSCSVRCHLLDNLSSSKRRCQDCFYQPGTKSRQMNARMSGKNPTIFWVPFSWASQRVINWPTVGVLLSQQNRRSNSNNFGRKYNVWSFGSLGLSNNKNNITSGCDPHNFVKLSVVWVSCVHSTKKLQQNHGSIEQTHQDTSDVFP